MWRSMSKAAFVRALRRLIPKITGADLLPAPAGIRAQAVAPDGSLLEDFSFDETRRVLNVINAPSPAATASLAVGRMIADKLALGLNPRCLMRRSNYPAGRCLIEPTVLAMRAVSF